MGEPHWSCSHSHKLLSLTLRKQELFSHPLPPSVTYKQPNPNLRTLWTLGNTVPPSRGNGRSCLTWLPLATPTRTCTKWQAPANDHSRLFWRDFSWLRSVSFGAVCGSVIWDLTKLDELNTWTYHSALMFITMWIVHGGLPRGVVVVGAWVCERGGNSFSSSIHL